MKLKRIQTVFLLILCAVMIAVGFPVTVRADMGPKPSVRIRFENMGDELCYGTLLSKTKSTSPASAWDGVESVSYTHLDVYKRQLLRLSSLIPSRRCFGRMCPLHQAVSARCGNPPVF